MYVHGRVVLGPMRRKYGRDHPSPDRGIPTRWPNHEGLVPAQRWQPSKGAAVYFPSSWPSTPRPKGQQAESTLQRGIMPSNLKKGRR